jgi:hypothetical protein
MAPPTTFSPVAAREIYIVKEAVPGTIPSSVGVPWALTSFKPSDKPIWIDDESWQGSMGDIYGVYQGPLIASLDGGGHVFSDTIGYPLYGIFGDYTVSGTAASPAGTTSAPVAVGATSLTVASGGASFTAGMWIWIEDGGSPAANEVVKIGAGSTSTNVVLDATTPTRFAHLTATPFTNTTAPYTHVFAVLNGSVGAAAGAGPGQPPTYCITDRQGLANNGANQYAYVCFSELVITGNSEKLLDFTFKATCASRATAGSAVGFANVSSELAVPSWRTAAGIAGPASGGTQVKYIGEHQVTMMRAVKPLNTEQGSQQPYVIARGKQSNTGKITIMPATDDSSLIAMLGNSQPQLQFLTSNGLGGANVRSLQVDILLAAYDVDDITDGGELFGYDPSFKAVHTAASSGGITMTGASGGRGAVKCTLINGVASY